MNLHLLFYTSEFTTRNSINQNPKTPNLAILNSVTLSNSKLYNHESSNLPISHRKTDRVPNSKTSASYLPKPSKVVV